MVTSVLTDRHRHVLQYWQCDDRTSDEINQDGEYVGESYCGTNDTPATTAGIRKCDNDDEDANYPVMAVILATKTPQRWW